MIWWFFLLLIAVLLYLDLGVLNRRSKDLSLYEALALSAFWVSLGLSFAVAVYFIYEYQWLGVNAQHNIDGKTAAIEYLTAYLVEETLSMDNLFVIALIFTSLNIPLGYQHRVLLWGIIGAIIMRGIFIVAGVYLLKEFSWMTYVFGAILLFSALKILASHQQTESDPQNSIVMRLIKRFLPVHPDYSSGRFFLRIDGKLVVTPLFVAMLMVESADLVFAVDSIPAVIGISNETFIIFSSNIFAVLGLRALYFVLAAAIAKLYYLKITLTLILLFIGIKMLLAHHIHISPVTSLIVITAFMVLGIVGSLLRKHEPVVGASPIGSTRLNAIYQYTFGSLRRAIILLIGTSVVLVGVIMIFTPGPAVLVIPAGLAILATEFVWARRLLQRFKDKFSYYRKQISDKTSSSTPPKDPP